MRTGASARNADHHFRLNATQRLELLLDSRWVEYDAALASSDPLHLPTRGLTPRG